LKQLFCPRFYDVSILERLRKIAANYKINLNELNGDEAGNQINEGISYSKNIELALKEKDKGSLNDKKSSTKSSNHTSNRNNVQPYVQEEKEKVYNNNNLNNNKSEISNPFAASSQDVSENNYFNDSDRKKLILTNDISNIENKSDILQNLANTDKHGLEVFEINLNNQSFGKKMSICDELNEIRGIKHFEDNKSAKEKKGKKLENEINKIDLLRDNMLKENNLIKKHLPETDEEIVLDLDIQIMESEEDKRIRKVRFNDKIKIDENKKKANEENYNISNKEQENDQVQNHNKNQSKNEILFGIKEQIYFDNDLNKNDSKENEIRSSSELENNSFNQEHVQVSLKISRSILKNRKHNLSDYKEKANKLNFDGNKETQYKATNSINSNKNEIDEKVIKKIHSNGEENKDLKNLSDNKTENIQINVPSEFNKDVFGEGGGINNIADSVINKNKFD